MLFGSYALVKVGICGERVVFRAHGRADSDHAEGVFSHSTVFLPLIYSDGFILTNCGIIENF